MTALARHATVTPPHLPRERPRADVVAMPARLARADTGTAAVADKLLRAMQLAKRARFNAHERLEAKHTASVAAFTLATVCEISLSLLTIVFGGKLATDVAPFIEYASVVTAVFLFGFGLVVGFGNYQAKAIYLQRCAMDISSLAREVEIALPVTADVLQEYRRRYHEIEARCPYNHNSVDLERALARTDDAAARSRALLRQAIDVYGPYAFAALTYSSLWATFWFLLRS